MLNFEREHAISKTNVVKRIADQVNTVGMGLHKSRTTSSGDSGESGDEVVECSYREFQIAEGCSRSNSLLHDSNRNITVIRAANESGKTALLSALQWGLVWR